MDENIRTILSVTIPALVAIIGFVVTYFLNKRNFQEELRKQKTNISLERISEVPYEILKFFNGIHDIGKKQQNKMLADFEHILAKVFAYGSNDAIAIAADMQEFNYNRAAQNDSSNDSGFVLMAYYTLLLCQVKYDLTGIKVNPGYWYRIKITDYESKKLEINSSVNELVRKIGLQDFLLIQ